MSQKVLQELALATDAEAESWLNGVLKGVQEGTTYGNLLTSPDTVQEALVAVASGRGRVLPIIREPSPSDRPKAVRAVLMQMAQDQDLCYRLEGWLDNQRPTLLLPIAPALVLAGIIVVLSTSVHFVYKNNAGGKPTIEIEITKPSMADSVLQKFMDIFIG